MARLNRRFRLMGCLLLSLLLFSFVSALPSEQTNEGRKTPDTVAGKFLKLALEKAEQVKQEKLAYEREKQDFKVQREYGTRHDRQWAQGKKTKDKQGH
jgi:hypothetical protein